MTSPVRYARLTAALVLGTALSANAERNAVSKVAVTPVEPRTVHVTQGHQVAIPLNGVKRVEVGDKKVAEAKVLEGTGADKESTAVEIREDPSEVLHVSIGHQVSLTAPGLRKVALGDPAVADINVLDNKEILLTGLSKGETTLLLWVGKGKRVSYLVKVAQRSPEDTAKELRELLTH